MTQHQLEIFEEGKYWTLDPTEIENPPHYSKYKIEPKEYITENNLGWCEGNVVKYITRWRDKGGIDDLRKAREFINILIEKETGVEKGKMYFVEE